MHLPGPLRAAVGLVATAAAEAKHLPDRAIELPMLAVSSALQASLRAQQRYARLTARGDEVLNRRTPTEEPPPWATFDEPVSLDDLRRTVGAPLDDMPSGGAAFGPAAADGAAAGRSMFDQLFAVEDPTLPADGREPVDEIPAFDEPLIETPAPAKKTAKKGTKKATAKKAATKSAEKTERATKKTAKVTKTTKSAAKGPLSKPRHTAPSAFDNVDDD